MVTFGEVVICDYSTVVGVNPGGGGGPPLAIGWDAVASSVIDIDVFETSREGLRRDHDELAISRADRENILRNTMGFSSSEIRYGTKAANIVRSKRRFTNEIAEQDRLYEKLEYCKRNVFHMANLGLKKRAERKYIKSSLAHNNVNRFKKEVDIVFCKGQPRVTLSSDKLSLSTITLSTQASDSSASLSSLAHNNVSRFKKETDLFIREGQHKLSLPTRTRNRKRMDSCANLMALS